MKKVKKIIAASLGVLIFPVVVFASTPAGVILNPDGSIGACIGAACSASPGGGGGGAWWLQNPGGSLPEGSIYDILSNFLYWLLAIFGIIGIIGFVVAGIIYLVSSGDDDMISRAKTAMRWSIIGVIVGLSGFVIMQAVALMLDAQAGF
jgi:hypothetical protein